MTSPDRLKVLGSTLEALGRHRSDSPRQIEGTWQYIRRHLAADSAARQLKPYTEAELSPKQQDPTKKFGRQYQDPTKRNTGTIH